MKILSQSSRNSNSVLKLEFSYYKIVLVTWPPYEMNQFSYLTYLTADIAQRYTKWEHNLKLKVVVACSKSLRAIILFCTNFCLFLPLKWLFSKKLSSWSLQIIHVLYMFHQFNLLIELLQRLVAKRINYEAYNYFTTSISLSFYLPYEYIQYSPHDMILYAFLYFCFWPIQFTKCLLSQQ